MTEEFKSRNKLGFEPIHHEKAFSMCPKLKELFSHFPDLDFSVKNAEPKDNNTFLFEGTMSIKHNDDQADFIIITDAFFYSADITSLTRIPESNTWGDYSKLSKVENTNLTELKIHLTDVLKDLATINGIKKENSLRNSQNTLDKKIEALNQERGLKNIKLPIPSEKYKEVINPNRLMH